ncbi:MAG: SRPBCC family protein [Oleispira sp.]|nr:SRPBCC family protein [Oleispira sp.]
MGNCYNSTTVNAPIDQVWDMIKDFHQLDWAAPVATKVDVVGELPGTQVGARRILNDAFHETLLSVDAMNHRFTYSIDDGPGPVAKGVIDNYVGRVELFPITDTEGTFVKWTSEFDSADETQVTEFCNPIYSGLLAALKTRF